MRMTIVYIQEIRVLIVSMVNDQNHEQVTVENVLDASNWKTTSKLSTNACSDQTSDAYIYGL